MYVEKNSLKLYKVLLVLKSFFSQKMQKALFML